MPREFTPEELGLTQEQYDYTPEAPSKLDALSSARESKLDALSYKLGQGLSPTDTKRDVNKDLYGLKDAWMGNKIENDYTPAELNHFMSKRYEEAGVYPEVDAEGRETGSYTTRDAQGNLVPFQGSLDDVGSLYLFGTKGPEDVNKLGHAFQEDPKQRYVDKYGRENTDYFGKAIGPKGVDTEQQKMNLLFRGDERKLFEGLYHANEEATRNRAYLPKQDWSEFGSGASEAYRGGLTGIFGDDANNPLPADIDQRYLEFKKKYGLPDYAQETTAPTQTSYGVDDWMKALVQVESGGNPDAVSPKGAFGLTQLMPATAKNPGFGIEPMRENTPEEQMRVGTEYFVALNNKYGNVDDALRAYNWGTGNVDKWIAAGRPEDAVPQETREYVGKVKGNLPQGVVQSAPQDNVGSYKQWEASQMGVPERIANALKGFVMSAAKESVVDFADWVGEATNLWDNGNEEVKRRFTSDFFGYNELASQAGLQEAEKIGKRITDGLFDKDKEVELGDVVDLMVIAYQNPEILTESMGSLAAMLIPYLGWAGKATKVGKANKAVASINKMLDQGAITKDVAKKMVVTARKDLTALETTVDMLRKSAGILQVSAGDVNDQIDEYVKEFGEQPTVGKVASMYATQVAMNAIDVKVDLSILKGSKEAVDSLRKAVDILPNTEKAKLAKRALGVAGTLVYSAGKEAAQEYVQTMGEILNVKWNFDEAGNPTAAEILTSKDTVAEGITAAGIGAGMGTEMGVIGEGTKIVSGVAPLVQGGLGRLKSGVQTGKETVSAVREDIRDAFGGDSFDDMLNSVAPTPEARGEQLDKVNTKRSADNTAQVEQLLQETVGAYNESLGANKTEFDEEVAAAVAVQAVSGMAEASAAQGPEAALRAAEDVSAMLVSLRAAGKAKEADAYSKQLLKLMPDMSKYFGTDKEGFKKYTSDVIEARASTGKGITREELKQVVKALSSMPNMDSKEAKDLITRAVNIGKAYKIAAGAGSDTETVGADVALGSRGFVNYFDGYRQAVAAGDTTAAAVGIERLSNFSALMANKSANLEKSLEEKRVEVNKAASTIPGFNNMTSNDKAIALGEKFKDENGKVRSFDVEYGTGNVGNFSYAPLIDEVVGRVPTEGLPVTAKNVAAESKAMQDLLDYVGNDIVGSKNVAPTEAESTKPTETENAEKPVVTEADDPMANADEWDAEAWLDENEEFENVVSPEPEEAPATKAKSSEVSDFNDDEEGLNAAIDELDAEINDAMDFNEEADDLYGDAKSEYYNTGEDSAWGDMGDFEPEVDAFDEANFENEVENANDDFADNFQATEEAKPKQDPLSKAKAAGKKRAEEAKAARAKAAEKSSNAWEGMSQEAQSMYKRQFSFRMADVTTEDMLKLIKEDYENYIKVADNELAGKPNVKKPTAAQKKAAIATLAKLNTMENNCG